MASPRKLCVSLDSSKLSEEALQWAGQHLVRQGDTVHLVTVVEPALKSDIAYGAGHSLVVSSQQVGLSWMGAW